MQKGGWVYMMPNRRKGRLYCGVTSDLARRAWQHRKNLVNGPTRLVWYEWHDDIRLAIQSEATWNIGRAPGRCASSMA